MANTVEIQTMAPTFLPTLATTTTTKASFPTVAIVAIAIGGYLFLFIIILLIRQCLLAKGVSLLPAWMTEYCACNCACGCTNGDGGCLQNCAETLNFSCPNKRSCLDSICPSREWCDKTFCCCMSSEPGGQCCEDCQGPECGCGDFCDCQCQCSTPNSINCICFEIKLN